MSNTRQSAQARTARRERAQAAKAHADEVLTYGGQEYRLAEKIGVWPMMQLARAAEQGMNSADSKGLAALHAMFEDMIHPGDWARFQEDMIAAKLDDPLALLQTTQQAVTRWQDRQEAMRKARKRQEDGDPDGSLDDEQRGGTRDYEPDRSNGNGRRHSDTGQMHALPAGGHRDYDIEP